MARQYEGSKADERQDTRGARSTGVSRRDYEKSSRDKREDAAGQKRFDAAGGGMRKGGKVAFGGKRAPPFGAKKGRK